MLKLRWVKRKNSSPSVSKPIGDDSVDFKTAARAVVDAGKGNVLIYANQSNREVGMQFVGEVSIGDVIDGVESYLADSYGGGHYLVKLISESGKDEQLVGKYRFKIAGEPKIDTPKDIRKPDRDVLIELLNQQHAAQLQTQQKIIDLALNQRNNNSPKDFIDLSMQMSKNTTDTLMAGIELGMSRQPEIKEDSTAAWLGAATQISGTISQILSQKQSQQFYQQQLPYGYQQAYPPQQLPYGYQQPYSQVQLPGGQTPAGSLGNPPESASKQPEPVAAGTKEESQSEFESLARKRIKKGIDEKDPEEIARAIADIITLAFDLESFKESHPIIEKVKSALRSRDINALLSAYNEFCQHFGIDDDLREKVKPLLAQITIQEDQGDDKDVKDRKPD